MTLRSILLTALVIAGVWYWTKSRTIKDLALKAAARYCDELSLSLLDQTVALRGIKLVRQTRGGWALERRYHFDFSSTGEDRYLGKIIMQGQRVTSITLAPHRID